MLARTDRRIETRPCLVLAHTDPVYQAVASRYLRQCGWDVFLAASGPQLRRLARHLTPTVAVLGTGLPGESGWLTCAKLRLEQQDLKIVLVSSKASPRKQRFAHFVGASDLIDRRDGVVRLVEAIFGAALRAVG
jgi:DNA-binding response OmpR family regulator